MTNCDPDQLEFNIRLDISSCGSARAILTATETHLHLHGGGSWREGETTGFWFFSPLPSYRYGNVTPCLLPPLRQIRAAHKSLGTQWQDQRLSSPTEMNAERGLSELPFAPPSCPVHKAEQNTYRSSSGDLGNGLGFLRSREMASNVIWFKLAQIWAKSPLTLSSVTQFV